MKALRFGADAFISEYHQAHAAGLTQRETAELMGLNYNTFCSRKHALKKRGVRLPALRKSGRRIAARPVLRLTGPVVQEPLHFTITVGG